MAIPRRSKLSMAFLVSSQSLLIWLLVRSFQFLLSFKSSFMPLKTVDSYCSVKNNFSRSKESVSSLYSSALKNGLPSPQLGISSFGQALCTCFNLIKIDLNDQVVSSSLDSLIAACNTVEVSIHKVLCLVVSSCKKAFCLVN